MGLNKISRDLHTMCHAVTDICPESKTQIDKVYVCLREALENLIYERKKEHMNRLPLYEKSGDVDSVLLICERITKQSKQKEIDALIKSLAAFYHSLEFVQDDIRTIRRNLVTLMDKIDAKYPKDDEK